MITLTINGEQKRIESGVTLRRFLDANRLNPNAVVVEHNKNVVARDQFDLVTLKEGDVVEIVQFVGGGAPEEGETQAMPESAPEVPATAPVGDVPAPETKVKKKRAPRKKSAIKTTGAHHLVIVESPSKAKTINKFLGGDYQVEASFGHVRDLPKSKMGVDFEQEFSPKYIVIKKASKTVKHLKEQARGKTSIYLAPDPDREGEAISWHLEHIFKDDGDKHKDTVIRRVVFNEITKEAILEAFRHPRDIKMNLVNAQQARRILDRIVGYELSPLLWRKVGRGLSAGRVQSVALRIIVDREGEIRSFVPVEYWSLQAKVSSSREENIGKIFLAKLDRVGDEKVDLKNQEQTEKIRAEVLTLPLKVESVDRRERSRKPQAPFTTSKLQQEAYNRLGFPAAKTMRVAQKLYEGKDLGEAGTVGLITYMRTDSVHIAASATQEAAEYIRQKFGDTYLPKDPPVYKSKKGAQEAHEAIRPSSVLREPEAIRPFLEDEEYKLYDLIWRKFLSSQMNPALDEMISVVIVSGEKYFFKSTGRRNLFPGFAILYGERKPVKAEEDEKEEDSTEAVLIPEELPNLEAGEILKLEELLGDQHFTKPPARFNDASLVKTLEEKGIGRPSTYAPTIYTLVSREYVARQGGAFIPSELGETVAKLLVEHFPRILEWQFTAKMEEELDKIEDGELDWVSVLKDFYEPFKADMAVAHEQMKNIRREVVPTDYVCSLCAKPMVIRMGRFGKFIACSGFPECKSTRSMPTGFFCPEPNCGGELVKRKSKNRRIFYGCSNYPKCTHIVNKLPKPDEMVGEDDKIAETDPGVTES